MLEYAAVGRLSNLGFLLQYTAMQGALRLRLALPRFALRQAQCPLSYLVKLPSLESGE